MPDKSLIVYYSWVGNTEAVAKEIQSQTGFDVQKIEEIRSPKPGNIMGAAMGAFFGLKSRIKPMDYQLTGYGNIFLGAQVWAGKTAPAINTYLGKASFKGKKVRLFITKADDKVPQGVIDSITRRIEKKGGKVIDSISFTTTIDKVIPREEIKDAIHEWLVKNGNYQK